jgi:hypothetical protein
MKPLKAAKTGEQTFISQRGSEQTLQSYARNQYTPRDSSVQNLSVASPRVKEIDDKRSSALTE